MSRHLLNVLPNGLLTIKIKVINPDNNNEVVCSALVDTGAEISCICTSIFNKLSFDKDKIYKGGTSSLDGETIVNAVNVEMKLPFNNWASFAVGAFVKDFSIRDEYDAIIGVNVLKNYQLVYHGGNKNAWLDEI